MTTPTYFTVVADFKSVVVDLASDVDADPTLGPISAKVTFTPLMQSGDVILATDASPRPIGFLPAPIVGRIDVDGRLKLRVEPDGDRDDFANLAAFPITGNAAKVYFAINTQTFYRWNGSAYVQTYPYAAVRLLADTDLLELSSELYYRVSFSDVVYNGASQYIAPFTFQAPNTDTELNLITVMRQPGQTASGMTKIAPGEVRLEGGDIIFSLAGVDIPDPIPFEPAFTSEEITDSTETGRSVLAAASPAGARAALKLPEIVYAADTIAADGVTDVSTSLGNLIADAPTGSTIQLEAGTYYAPTMKRELTNSVTLLGVPGKTKILGNGTRTGQHADYLFYVSAGSITLRDIDFEDTWTPVAIKELRDIGDILIDHCTFTGCSGVVIVSRDDVNQAAQLAAGETYSFRNFRMSHCQVTSCELGVRLNTMGGWNSVIVHDSVFNDVGHAAVYTGFSYKLPLTLAAQQPRHGAVTIHDNHFRNIRASSYDLGPKSGANAVLCMGQAVHIHNNYIEDVGVAGLTNDSEGIYTKARYTHIHNNVLVDAGGNEAAIMVKGSDVFATTYIAAESNGATLPQSTIYVESTEGFEQGITGGYKDRLVIVTSGGNKTVSYVGKTDTSFTGVTTSATGTLTTGDEVRSESTANNTFDALGSPTRVHNNTIVFSDGAQAGLKAIATDCRRVHITDNMVVGCTGRAFSCLDGGTIERNTVYDHHGNYVIGVYGSGCVVRENRVYNFDASSYPASSSYSVITVQPSTGQVMRDVQVIGNTLRNQLTSGGARTTAQTKTRMVVIASAATGSLDDCEIRDNRARNLSIGINVLASGTITNLRDIDNSWINEDGSSPTVNTSHATSRSARYLPTANNVSGFTIQTITGSATISTTLGDQIVLIDTGGLPTLGTAVGSRSRIVLKNRTAAGVVIGTTSSQTIEGAASYTLPAGQAIEVVGDSTGNWSII
jgi:hypothetical protein